MNPIDPAARIRRGDQLYSELCDTCAASPFRNGNNGRMARLAIIGAETLKLIEEYLAYTHRRVVTLQEVGFANGTVPWQVDKAEPSRLSILIDA